MTDNSEFYIQVGDLLQMGLDISMPWQRGDVWGERHRARAIESWIRDHSGPSIILHRAADGQATVVQGKQAILAIRRYRANGFTLSEDFDLTSGIHYSLRFSGCRFEHLGPPERKYFDSIPVFVTWVTADVDALPSIALHTQEGGKPWTPLEKALCAGWRDPGAKTLNWMRNLPYARELSDRSDAGLVALYVLAWLDDDTIFFGDADLDAMSLFASHADTHLESDNVRAARLALGLLGECTRFAGTTLRRWAAVNAALMVHVLAEATSARWVDKMSREIGWQLLRGMNRHKSRPLDWHIERSIAFAKDNGVKFQRRNRIGLHH